LRATGFPDIDELLPDSLLDPIDPAWVTAYFEFTAGHGPDPASPPPAGRTEGHTS
jgi:hypothetical protein